MIRLENILSPGRSLVNVPGGSKKRVLEQIAKVVAQDLPGLEAQAIFESLFAREKLGSTGFGNGIAIPHCRLEQCTEAVGALLQLDRKIDFDSLDGEPVDLIFVLLVPHEATEQHLQILKVLAEKLDQEELREALRQAPDAQTLYRVMVDGNGG